MERKKNKTSEFVPYLRGSKWIYYYYTTDEFGKRKTKFSRAFDTEEEAITDSEERQSVFELFEKDTLSTTKMAEYLEKWLKTSYINEVKNSTYLGAEKNVRVHIIPLIGNKQIGKLSKDDVARMIKTLLNKGLSPSSVRFIFFTLRKSLSDAVKEGIIPANVCKDVQAPIPRKKRRTLVPPNQAKEFLEMAKEHGIYLEVLLGLNFGLRRGEILGLQFRDFDFDNDRLYVERQIGRYQTNDPMLNEIPKYGWKVIDNLKSDQSEKRPLSVSPEMKELILNLKKKYIETGVCKASKIEKCFVCCRPDGSFKTPDCIRKPFDALRNEAGRPNLRFHDLRHTFASFLIENGIPIAGVSAALGHASVDTTYKSYYDVINADKEIASKMASSLF